MTVFRQMLPEKQFSINIKDGPETFPVKCNVYRNKYSYEEEYSYTFEVDNVINGHFRKDIFLRYYLNSNIWEGEEDNPFVSHKLVQLIKNKILKSAEFRKITQELEKVKVFSELTEDNFKRCLNYYFEGYPDGHFGITCQHYVNTEKPLLYAAYCCYRISPYICIIPTILTTYSYHLDHLFLRC